MQYRNSLALFWYKARSNYHDFVTVFAKIIKIHKHAAEDFHRDDHIYHAKISSPQVKVNFWSNVVQLVLVLQQ